MGLELATTGATTNLEDLEGELLKFVDRFGMPAPEYRRLYGALYDSPSFGPEQVQQLEREFRELREKYREHRMDELRRTRKVHAKDPAVAESILSGLLTGDRVLAKIDDVLRVCDAAIASRASVVSESD